MYISVKSLIAILATLIFTNLANAAATDTSDKNFNETVYICLNLDSYGELALKSRESGMPLETATELVSASMKKNLSSVPTDTLIAYIDVVKDLYKIVREDSAIQQNTIDNAIFKACSKYHGYQVDTEKLKLELSKYVQSAFDQFKRVPLCQKAGETAANITVARDKGMKKSEILKLAEDGLGNDEKTKEMLPTIISEIYAFPKLDTSSFYLYNIYRCNAKQEGKKIVSIKSANKKVIACQKISDKNEKTECLQKLFSLQ